MKQVKEIPVWFKLMPLNGKLNSREVAELFGFKNSDCVNSLASHGDFPKADGFTKRNTGIAKAIVNLWSKKTILQEIQRRKELAKNEA